MAKKAILISRIFAPEQLQTRRIWNGRPASVIVTDRSKRSYKAAVADDLYDINRQLPPEVINRRKDLLDLTFEVFHFYLKKKASCNNYHYISAFI